MVSIPVACDVFQMNTAEQPPGPSAGGSVVCRLRGQDPRSRGHRFLHGCLGAAYGAARAAREGA